MTSEPPKRKPEPPQPEPEPKIFQLEGEMLLRGLDLQDEFLRVQNTFKKKSRGKMELSAAQALVLLAIEPEQTVTQLAARLYIAHSAMYYALQSLIDAELIRGTRSAEDKRRIEYSVTDTGLRRAANFSLAADRARRQSAGTH